MNLQIRPELKVERCSYDVIIPSAAIRSEIMSRPTAPFQSYNGSEKPLYVNNKTDVVQRLSILLCDVSYVVEAHFEMTERANATDNPAKFRDIIMRRLERGSYYHMPYFGCREFPAHFCLCEEDPVRTAYDQVEERDLGLMLYDMDYSDPDNIQPTFFRAVMSVNFLSFYA